ncbi:MAG: S8 family serine peptidase [Planctomycetes bacterium]|nr:S8 family serine peptidase [Planctomycetota bacterium]
MRSSLLCSTVLSMLPVAVAQAPAVTAVRADASAQVLQFSVGGITMKRWHDAAGDHVAMSRDGGASWTQLMEADDLLRFRLASFDPRAGEPEFAGVLGVAAGARIHVVQFHTQVMPQYREALQNAGVEILHFLPAQALLVRGDAAQVAGLRALPFVRWTGAMANAFKLDDEARAFAGSNEAAKELNLQLAAKKDRQALAAQVAAIGGKVTDLCDGSIMIRASLTPAQLQAVLAFDTFLYADFVTETGIDMDNARIQGGGNYVETMGGYTGQGVRAEITEPFQETHPDFAGRFIVRGTVANTVQSHGHCTAGIVAGAGAGNAAARGMLPACTVIENGYYPNTGVHYANIIESVNPTAVHRSMQATSSWGAAQTPNYTTISASVDDALFDADFVRTQSMSNLGNQNVRPEAWPKNTISVGGVSHGNNSNPADDVWSSASIGPASDGRLKPEVCAYYDNVLTSDRTGTSGYTTGDYYTAFSGTSSATPIVNGHVGLIQQMYTDGLFGNPLPLPATAANRFENRAHMSTTKALLCNTAAQYTFSGTGANLSRYKQGWGFPGLQRLYDNRNSIVVADEYDTLQVGQNRTYTIWVAPGTPELRVTMVYTDPAGVALSAVHLVNNLNLKVTQLSTGTFWFGNNGLAAGNFSTSGGVANDRDNLEAVYLQNPAAGIYLVEVAAASIVQDAKVETPQVDADFALVMHPMGGGYRRTGGVTLDLNSTGPGNLTFSASNVPASGWTEGYTALSFNTTRGLGFGKFFGIEDDGLTVLGWSTAAAAGNPFHFTNTGGVYPFANFVFPDPSIISFLAGIQVDGVMILFNGADVAAVSNVDRLTLQ